MPGFKFFEANAEPILNYDGDMLEELAWDEDCAWAEWHSVEDPVKGIAFNYSSVSNSYIPLSTRKGFLVTHTFHCQLFLI